MRILQQLIQQRQWIAAEARIGELRKRAQFDPNLLFNLSYVLNEQGRVGEAVTALRQCLGAAPHFVPAMVNMSVLLIRMGDVGQAIAFAQRAAQAQPRDPTLHAHLSKMWSIARNSRNAIEALDEALRLQPADPALLTSRIDLLAVLGRDGEAAVEARKLLALPRQEHGLHALSTLLAEAAQRSAWNEQAVLLGRLQKALHQPSANCNPTRLMMIVDDPQVLKQAALASAIPTPSRPRPRPGNDPRITIGYFSADVRQHPVAQMLINVLEHHDRERFQLVLLSLAPSDGSAVAEHARRLFATEVDLSQLSEPGAVEAIRNAGIDVLVDLMGLTQGNRIGILAYRPSPVQLLWLGCPVTTGYQVYDAFLLDEQVAPPGYDGFCSEPLYRLPLCYHPISTGEPEGSSTLDRARAGLPADALVVGIFPQVDRVRPPFIEQVARTIAVHPRAHLWLRAAVAVRPQVVEQLAAWGLPAERVHFISRFDSRADYLQAQRLVDVLVDSFPYGGHSTTGEALAMGVPVLCRRGATIHSRVAASMMHSLGLGDLVAASEEEQFRRLDELLADPACLQRWRERFTAVANQPAEDRHVRLTRALEEAYGRMLQQVSPAAAS